jgi:hypothetical protein
MTRHTNPVNEQDVDGVLESMTDPIQRNLVRVAIAKARMRFMRPTTMGEAEFVAQLPSESFDMGFFASLMKDLFANRELLNRLLRGDSIEEASEWPI